VQIHRRPDAVKMFSRKGYDITERFPEFLESFEYLPECIIDGELVACDSDGRPDFAAIARHHDNLCVWGFDLLFDGHIDIREMPLTTRKDRLRQLIVEFDNDVLRYSEEFADPVKLLKVAEKMGLEGIVSKRRCSPYRAHPRADWIKVKTEAWREANKDRWEMFEKRKPSVSLP
jgi:bifunctional non-homologous end joining protein LigD